MKEQFPEEHAVQPGSCDLPSEKARAGDEADHAVVKEEQAADLKAAIIHSGFKD